MHACLLHLPPVHCNIIVVVMLPYFPSFDADRRRGSLTITTTKSWTWQHVSPVRKIATTLCMSRRQPRRVMRRSKGYNAFPTHGKYTWRSTGRALNRAAAPSPSHLHPPPLAAPASRNTLAVSTCFSKTLRSTCQVTRQTHWPLDSRRNFYG